MLTLIYCPKVLFSVKSIIWFETRTNDAKGIVVG